MPTHKGAPPTVDKKLDICFVAHFAYGAIANRPTGHIGGVERQQSLMARWLASRGHRVSMLTWDEGQGDGQQIDGVRVFTICKREDGLRGLRFFHPRWTGLLRAMRRANAEVYYQNCGEYVTGQVALWCRRHQRKFVYSVANDPDVDPRLPEMKTLRERILYRCGLCRADRVIVQTQTQQTRLREGFGLTSVVIPMPCLAEPDGSHAAPPSNGSSRILWIGRIAEQKRFDRLLDVARDCPDLKFDVVGGANAENQYTRTLKEQAHSLPNVTMHGYVPYQDTPQYYRQAALLCCTSAFEGFPNTFLEAWSHGLPVVSTFDPDHLIARQNLGIAAADVPGLVTGIRHLLAFPDRWARISENAHRYYLENHTMDAVMPRFERVFIDVLNPVSSAGN